MFSLPTHPSLRRTGSACVYWDWYPLSKVRTIGLPAPRETPRLQYACTWSSVTACQPALFSACICAVNSSGATYRPGNGAPGGGAAITWYMRIGTDRVPGWPVAEFPVAVWSGRPVSDWPGTRAERASRRVACGPPERLARRTTGTATAVAAIKPAAWPRGG